MEDHGKSKKKLGLSLKSAKKRALEFSKADSKKAARKLDSRNARNQTVDEYFTKQKQEKIDKCLADGIKDEQHVNSKAEQTEGLEETRGLSISSTRMKLLNLMPVFPDWKKMKPLPFSPLMKSFSERKKANSDQGNDPKEGTNEKVEPEKNDATNGYHWKDLPKFDAGLFAEKVQKPLSTVENSQEDYLEIDSPTTSAALQVDCDSKSNENRLCEASNVGKFTEESKIGKFPEIHVSNVNETAGKRKSNPTIEVGGRFSSTGETSSSQGKNELASRASKVEKGTSDDELLAIYQDIDLEDDSMDCVIVSDTIAVSPKRSGKPSSRIHVPSEVPSKTFGQTKRNEPVLGSGNSENFSMNFQPWKSPQPCTIVESDNQKGSHGECGSRSSTTFKENEKTHGRPIKKPIMFEGHGTKETNFVDNKTKDFPEHDMANVGKLGVNSIKKDKMWCQSSEKPSHDGGNVTGNVETKGEESICKPGWLGEQSKQSVYSRSYTDGSMSPVVVVNSGRRTADFVNFTNKSCTQPDVLRDRGEKAKYSSQNNDGKSIGNLALFDNAAKEPMSSAQFKGKESSCSQERLEGYHKRTMNYTKSKTTAMFLGESEEERDRTKGEKVIPSSSSFGSSYMNAEGSKAPLTRTAVPGNVNQKNNTGLRNEKRASFESVSKSPCANVTNLENNVRSDNTLTVSGKDNKDKGGNLWINEDMLYEEDDGLDDFIRSFDSDLNDDDLVSCCDDLMSPIIPVRKNTSSTRQRNYTAEDKTTHGCLSKGAKRRLEIPDGQSKISRSDRTDTSDPGLLLPAPTTLSKNKVGGNVLKDCPICLEHFHSGLSKRDIDQHIDSCLESEDMTKDSDELFW